MTALRAVPLGLMLSACVQTAGVPTPLTMPPADGRGQVVTATSQDFVVSRRANPTVTLRVTRVNGPDLDYSEGVVAKRAAQAYCASFNRALDPAALGRYSLPNAWVFGGDCV